MEYIVALEFITGSIPSVYIAPWAGDPGRTCIEKSAKRFDSISSATFSLAHARKYRKFLDAKVIEISK